MRTYSWARAEEITPPPPTHTHKHRRKVQHRRGHTEDIVSSASAAAWRMTTTFELAASQREPVRPLASESVGNGNASMFLLQYVQESKGMGGRFRTGEAGASEGEAPGGMNFGIAPKLLPSALPLLRQ